MKQNQINKIIEKTKDVLQWSKIYWDRTHYFDEENEYSEQDINEAFNKWNWAERDLKKLIEEYHPEKEPVKSEDVLNKVIGYIEGKISYVDENKVEYYILKEILNYINKQLNGD